MTAIKPALFALLAINAGIYAIAGRFSEGLDALAWFALLVLFDIETRCPRWTRIPRHAIALDVLRLLAACGVATAAVSFIHERQWLDAANAWLWIGVVALLELQVRAPHLATRLRKAGTACSLILYGALAGIATLWLVRGDWLNGYDAVLWIAAFALIEMDLLRLAGAPERDSATI